MFQNLCSHLVALFKARWWRWIFAALQPSQIAESRAWLAMMEITLVGGQLCFGEDIFPWIQKFSTFTFNMAITETQQVCIDSVQIDDLYSREWKLINSLQLTNIHLRGKQLRPDYQHLVCPAIPLVYRLWSNFPTCQQPQYPASWMEFEYHESIPFDTCSIYMDLQ